MQSIHFIYNKNILTMTFWYLLEVGFVHCVYCVYCVYCVQYAWVFVKSYALFTIIWSHNPFSRNTITKNHEIYFFNARTVWAQFYFLPWHSHVTWYDSDSKQIKAYLSISHVILNCRYSAFEYSLSKIH